MNQALSIQGYATESPSTHSSGYFCAWKRAVKLVGIEWFGDGSVEGFERATEVKHLKPNVLLLTDALRSMRDHQRLLLSVMVSFFHIGESNAMLARCGLGFADIANLDPQRHQAVIDLLQHRSDD